MKLHQRVVFTIGLASVLAMGLTACGQNGQGGGAVANTGKTDVGSHGAATPPANASAADASARSAPGTPVKVGVVYAETGLFATYGAEYREGFEAGLKYATHGTAAVDGHPLKVTFHDAATNPAKAVSEVKTLIGQGYKIIAGPVSSGVSLQVAPLAARNKILYISGPAAADAITGINKYTFRSGRQSWQDVKTAAAMLRDPTGETVVVFAQDYAFGKANVAAVTKVLGGEGATVKSILVPLSATDFTPFVQKIKNDHPDMLFVAWAGSSTGAMWNTLAQQGVFKHTKVVTGLGNVSSYAAYGTAATKVDFLSYYFPGAIDNPVNKAMIKLIKEAGGEPDLFSPDGFVAAQMIVHALDKTDGNPDVDGMIKALAGWTFDAPKGKETIRAADHAMLQPMFIATLLKDEGDDAYHAQPLITVPAAQLAPPVSAHFNSADN